MANVGLVIKYAAKDLVKALSKNSPTLFTAIAVGGVFTTLYLGIDATPKALRLIEDSEFYKEKELTKAEIFKLVWRLYIPTAVSAAVTVGSIIGAHSISSRRNAALAGVYALTEQALREYQEKVVESIGKNKELRIRDSIAEDRLEKDPVKDTEIILTGRGETLCYDSLSGRYFKSDIELIRKVQNDFNAELLNEMYKPLNEFYNEIGLQDTDLGRNMGWEADGLLDIHFSAKIASSGVPCIVLEYKRQPHLL